MTLAKMMTNSVRAIADCQADGRNDFEYRQKERTGTGEENCPLMRNATTVALKTRVAVVALFFVFPYGKIIKRSE